MSEGYLILSCKVVKIVDPGLFCQLVSHWHNNFYLKHTDYQLLSLIEAFRQNVFQVFFALI